MNYATGINVHDQPETRAPEEHNPRAGLAAAIDPSRVGVSAPGTTLAREQVFIIEGLTASYGSVPAVRDVSFDIYRRMVTAIIGPSGCGKSTFIRCLNRMNDVIPSFSTQGKVLYHGVDLQAKNIDPVSVRRRIGMVFQRPNPFPKSIYENVAYGLRILGLKDDLDGRVERALKRAALWDEVKDRLGRNAFALSGGQQQRLCIARCLAVEPDVLLMDEPTSSLDPSATKRIEELLSELVDRVTIVIVTHNMQQAHRVSDHCAFLLSGEDGGGRLVETGETRVLFETPNDDRTADYVAGRFG